MGKEMTPEEKSEIIAKLEADGYVIKRKTPTVKRTFEMDEGLWKEADQIRRARKITSREMLHESLLLWIADQLKQSKASPQSS